MGKRATLLDRERYLDATQRCVVIFPFVRSFVRSMLNVGLGFGQGAIECRTCVDVRQLAVGA